VRHFKEITRSEHSLSTRNVEMFLRNNVRATRHSSLVNVECGRQCLNISSRISLWRNKQFKFARISRNRHTSRIVVPTNELKITSNFTNSTQEITCISTIRTISANVANVNLEESVVSVILIKQLS